MTITEGITTRSLDVPGARLHYGVRGGDFATPLFVVGSPMGTADFAPFACIESHHDPKTAEAPFAPEKGRSTNGSACSRCNLRATQRHQTQWRKPWLSI